MNDWLGEWVNEPKARWAQFKNIRLTKKQDLRDDEEEERRKKRFMYNRQQLKCSGKNKNIYNKISNGEKCIKQLCESFL